MKASIFSIQLLLENGGPPVHANTIGLRAVSVMAHSKGPAGAAAQVARGDATSDLGAVSGSHLRSSRDMGWPRKHSHANLASFEGSFAASARPGASAARAKPWYADREYFLQGWTSRAIWKAAVSCQPLLLTAPTS